MRSGLLTGLFTLCLVACAAEENLVLDGDEETDIVEDGKADRDGQKALATFYTLRRDERKCAAPMCGGYWVKRARWTTTRCADGTTAAECYVADMDLDAIGLSAEDDEWLRGTPELLLVRGSLAQQTFADKQLGALQATEAWRASGTGKVDGPYYLVEDLGVRCITSPCFSLNASRVNSTKTYTLSGLAGPLAEAAAEMLLAERIIVAGSVKRVPNEGPAGDGRSVDVNEYFTRVEAQPAACRTAEDCEITAYSRPVASPAQCYCASCADAVLSRSAAEANRESWERYCSGVRLACAPTTCAEPRAATCERNTCGATP